MRKRVMRRALSLVLAIAICAGSVAQNTIQTEAAKAKEYTSGDYTYTMLGEDTVTVTGYTGNESAVVIPEKLDGHRVTAIGQAAFKGNAAVRSVTIPDAVEDIGAAAFQGCSNLQSVNYPLQLKTCGGTSGVFADCPALTKMVVPEGVTSLAGYVFYKMASLKEIELPSTLTHIQISAFEDCTGLERIALPEGVTEIEREVFNGCSALYDVKLPANLRKLGASAFLDCISLGKIALPDSLTELGNAVFRGCTNLKYIVLPEGITELDMNLFMNASSLASVEVPVGLRVISSETFKNCVGLTDLYLPDTVDTIRTSSFEGCDNLTVYCPDYSKTAITLADMGMRFGLTEGTFDDTYLSRENTRYMAASADSGANGYIPLYLSYEFKEAVAADISDMKLKILVPQGMELLERTLMVDDVVTTDYKLRENELTIDLQETAGEISFCLNPLEDSRLVTYAVVEYKYQKQKMSTIVGIINDEVPVLSLTVPSCTSSGQVTVKGAGPAESRVDIYVEDVLSATVTTNKAGSFLAQVELPQLKDYASYRVAVKANIDGQEYTVSDEVSYNPLAPIIKECVMTYGKQVFDLLELGTKKPTLTFDADKEIAFQMTFENAENIDKVYICSTRSNITKRMEAKWNDATGTYEAKGYFDENEHSYVPGTITVEYSQKKEPVSFTEPVDYTSPQYVNGLSDPLLKVVDGKAKECVEIITSTDNQLKGLIKLTDIDNVLDFNILTDVIPSYLDPSNAGQYGYEAYTDDAGAKLYMKLFEEGEDKVRGEIIDFGKDTLTEYFIDTKNIRGAAAVDSYSSFMTVLGYADTMVTWDNNNQKISDIRRAILSSDMSEEAKAEALGKLELASDCNNSQIAIMTVSILATVAGIAIPAPFSVGMALFAMKKSMCMEDILGELGFLETVGLDGLQASFRWKIDPSGYIYDIDTQERLEGATVTAYWIPADGTDAFWENVPADTVEGTLWDASEWDQISPLITDEDGRYAWDVPEGWWRVKCELDNYETVWSEWLPVPPPQTEVNLGMKCINPVVYATGDVNRDGAVDAEDVEYLKKYLAGGWDCSVREELADLNDDGAVNMRDVVLLRRSVGGWSSAS